LQHDDFAKHPRQSRDRRFHRRRIDLGDRGRLRIIGAGLVRRAHPVEIGKVADGDNAARPTSSAWIGATWRE
jgi:hypothetical protein